MTSTVTPTTAQTVLRRLNMPFIGSFLVVVVAYLVALGLLRIVVPDTEVAATLSAMVIGAGPRVQQELERRLPRSRVPVVSLDGYSIRWWLLLMAGIAAIWLAESARIVIGLRGGPATTVSASANDALTLLPVAAAFGIGLVAGARSDRWPLLVAAFAIVLGHLAGVATSDRAVTFAVGAEPPAGIICQPADAIPAGPPDAGPPGAGAPDVCPPDPRPGLLGTDLAATLLADELPLLVLVGMVALWWGSRMRYAFYLGHVAGGLDDADRAALAAMAAEELRRRDAAPPS